jgi:hypothetical protein
MSDHFIQRLCTLMVAICLSTLPVLQTANAAIIPTETAIEITNRQHQIDRVNDLLARDTVQSVLVDLGVNPDDASARVQSLTDAELRSLENRLAELPAGGVGFVEVVGIVAIVLIVLELLHVTNFFAEF